MPNAQVPKSVKGTYRCHAAGPQGPAAFWQALPKLLGQSPRHRHNQPALVHSVPPHLDAPVGSPLAPRVALKGGVHSGFNFDFLMTGKVDCILMKLLCYL